MNNLQLTISLTGLTSDEYTKIAALSLSTNKVTLISGGENQVQLQKELFFSKIKDDLLDRIDDKILEQFLADWKKRLWFV